MTFYFPDIYHGNRVTIEPGTVAVIAKRTHATSIYDSAYENFKAQANNVRAKFLGYHWLNHGNIKEQAEYCYQHDPTVPVMIDAEDTYGNTGYNAPLTVNDILGFALEIRRLGGVCNLVYLPHWYWQDVMQSPDLTLLVDAGMYLVSSNYTMYSDTGPGWESYGGMTPLQWQYTSTHPYGGASAVDFNAVRGMTVEQWWKLVSGKVGTMALSEDKEFWQNFLYAIWRVEALTHLLDNIQEGPEKGVAVELSTTLKSIDANVKTLVNRDVTLSDTQFAELKAQLTPDAIVDAMVRRLPR